jgi:3-hydroxybutyryl-CoA dehydrogenase
VFAEGGALVRGSPIGEYIFARILAAIINEAYLALGDHVASDADIDTAMRLGTNYPRGPLEWSRKIGLPTCVALLEGFERVIADGRYIPARSLAAIASSGSAALVDEK